jgi:hypothetical protein
MAVATERLVVLMEPVEKAALEAKALRAGVSVAELTRRAVSAYDPEAEDDEIEALLTVLQESHERTLSALAEAEAEIAETRAYFAAKRAAV